MTEGAYESWVVRGAAKYSFGTFNTTDNGVIDGEFDLDGFEPQNGDKVVATIEPVPDTDPDLSAAVVLVGDLDNGSATLAFPIDISGFVGATPTNGADTDETAGVWFLDPASETASLNIPDAPTGWVCEGWVVHQGQPLTTGRFVPASGSDLFSGFSGMHDGPAFPGEDFLANLPDELTAPLNLADGASMVVISIEPDIDGVDPTGDKPSQVKPLSGAISEGAATHSLFNLNPETAVPSGSASL